MSRKSSGKLNPQAFAHQIVVLAACAASIAILESGYDDLPVWKHLFGLFGITHWSDYG